jgi:hypothetical protein
MANKVLAVYGTPICEIYIDDVLIYGSTDNEDLDNTPKTTLITNRGTSFTEEKRLQVLDFPLPEKEKALLQLIGLEALR